MNVERRKANACLTLNLILPGTGTLLIGKMVAGSVQLLISLGSLAGFTKGALDGYKYCMRLLEGQTALEGYLSPLLWITLSLIMFKIPFIWAQISTAKFYKQARNKPT